MNSTDAKTNTAEIRRIFYEQMLPLGERMKKEHKDFYETRADPQRSSYFIRRKQRTATKDSFAPIGCESEAALAAALAALWKSQGYDELVPLAQTFAQLAESMRASAEQPDEVSPFIYVMF